jgi:hypothetical protein
MTRSKAALATGASNWLASEDRLLTNLVWSTHFHQVLLKGNNAMKLNAKRVAIILLGFSTFAAAKILTTDPLTGLPLMPATANSLGNEPVTMPDWEVCKSKVQSDSYSVYNSKVSVTLKWYAERLSGFQKAHGFVDGRSQDVFYSADGTTVVAVTGNQGKDGEDTETYGVSYTRFQPGLPAKAIIGIIHHNIVCN